MWQDYVFTIGLSVFAVSLIPTVIGKQKPPLITAVPTALTQFVLAATSLTLNLRLAATVGIINGVLWSTLAVQRYRQNQ